MKITVLALFLASPVFGQNGSGNISGDIIFSNIGASTAGHWVQTDNASLRAQDRKKHNNFVISNYSNYFYPNYNLNDTDAMIEQYILNDTHEICGTVAAYEEAPDLIHYKVHKGQTYLSDWETKESAEKAVVEACAPKYNTCNGWTYTMPTLSPDNTFYPETPYRQHCYSSGDGITVICY